MSETYAVPKDWEREPDGLDPEDFKMLLRRQKETLTDVATGTSIASRADEYEHRHERLRRASKNLGIDNPFYWGDLNQFWFEIRDKWPTYGERRSELGKLLDAGLDAVDEIDTAGPQASLPGWDLPLDDRWRGLAERAQDLKTEYESANTIDGYQDVGRRARQIIIEAVKLAWQPEMIPSGEEEPKADDAKTKLAHIQGVVVPGKNGQRMRKFVRSALDLGHETTHDEQQEGMEAMASAMGAIMAVRLLQEFDRSYMNMPKAETPLSGALDLPVGLEAVLEIEPGANRDI